MTVNKISHIAVSCRTPYSLVGSKKQELSSDDIRPKIGHSPWLHSD